MPTMNTIGKHISTNINKNHSSDRGQQVMHILMYVEQVRAYKENIAHATTSMRKCTYLYLVYL